MKLSDISIARPVFASVLSIAIILIGYVSFTKLAVREYPKIDEPAVTIVTTYPGASAEIMESQITKIIEDGISGIEGIKYTTSTSREGTSVVQVKFNLDRDPDNAAAEVRDKVSRVRGRLPDEVDEPIISKVEADSSPIMWLVMQSDYYTPAQLTELADNMVKDRIQTIDGVADIFIFGERKYAMRIWLDPEKMASLNVTATDIESALLQQNVDIPSGRIEGLQREFIVQSNTDINTKEEFENVVISNRAGRLIKMSDVGKVTLGVENDRVSFKFNGKTSVGLGVVKQSVANPLDISKSVNELLKSINNSLPKNVTLQIGYDSTQFISKSVENVFKTLFEAMILVSLVIFLFLRSWRATLIPLVTIPVSLIGTFTIMLALGFTINTLTLLAFVLAIGLVVDDAIVMMENIYRYIENGMKPIAAAFKGAREVGFAVVAMTITLAAVYAPVAFIDGKTGKLFVEFAITLASTVIISGFVALSLSPMMSSRLLKKEDHSNENKFFKKITEYLERLDNFYKRTLTRFLAFRFVAIPTVLVIFLGIFITSKFLRSELSPLEDRGAVFMAFVGPEGATTDYMNAYASQLEKIIQTIPEINRYGIVTGIGSGRLPVSNQGLSFMRTTDWSDRDRKTTEIAQAYAPEFFDVSGILAFPIVPQSLGGGGFSKPLEFIVKDTRSYRSMNEYVEKILAEMAKNSNFIGTESDLKINTPNLKLNFNRNKLADLGINVGDAGRALETFLATRKLTRFKQDSEQYDAILAVDETKKLAPDDLDNIYLRSKSGELVPVSNLAEYEETVAPRDLNHFDRMRSIKITSNLSPNFSIAEAIEFMEEKAAEILPKSAQVDYDGQSREFLESSQNIYLAFVLAIMFIFLVLAAQFESFIDPLVIMITVPLSMFGALLALLLTGNSLNIYSQIGLITLVGLITKHGILMVEFANQKQQEGYFLQDAIMEAALQRLRPILMTTAATVLGAAPLAFAMGAGAESRHQIGWVIVGGMTLGTIMTLYIVPVFYLFFNRGRKNIVEIPTGVRV
ncbi:MAG TPA: multidrug transporter AcrB [Alphaproteobacteria bacterium]|nr:multidrug transporter AcrB [Alphaproteobacteria bacterium]